MRRHSLDPVSLVFGVIFLFVSASYLLTHTTSVRLHWLLAVPAGLIVIGVAVLAVSVQRIQRSDAAADGTEASLVTESPADADQL
jgi:hypothetical protein